MTKESPKQAEFWELIEKGPVFADELPENLRKEFNNYYKNLVRKKFPIETFCYYGSGIGYSKGRLGIAPFRIFYKKGEALNAYGRIECRYPDFKAYHGRFRAFAALLKGHVKKKPNEQKYIE